MKPRLSPLSAALLLAVACGSKDEPAPVDTCPLPGLVKGVALSPAGFPLDYTKVPEFLAEVGAFRDSGVMWNGAWRDDAVAGTDAGTVPLAAQLVSDSAAANCYTPVVVFGWRAGETLFVKVPSDATNDWTNAAAVAAFQAMLAAYAAAERPPFVFLGNENDFYAEQSSAGYAAWLAAYGTLRDAVKAASPATLVGPIFNFEHLSGTGALNGWTTPRWSALTDHDLAKVDVVGLTVYPFFQHASVAAVPDAYLAPLFDRIGAKPVAITETGWPAEDLGGLDPPWSTSEAEQVAYVSKLFTLTAGRDVRLVNWLFLNPMVDPGGSPVEWKLFGSVSLRDAAGQKRPAYTAWEAR
jgi:hypothetical protein